MTLKPIKTSAKQGLDSNNGFQLNQIFNVNDPILMFQSLSYRYINYRLIIWDYNIPLSGVC